MKEIRKSRRTTKLRLLLDYYMKVYLAKVCICGEKKPRAHWLCKDCYNMMKDTPEMARLIEACDEWVDAIQGVLSQAKQIIEGVKVR